MPQKKSNTNSKFTTMADNTSQFTPEQISYAEHTLKAEIKKIKKRINEINAKIEELKPKGLFGIFKDDHEYEIEMLKDELSKLEYRLIDLEEMTATDYIIHKQKQDGNNEESGESGMLDDITDSGLIDMAADAAGAFIPGGNAIGQVAGSLLKSAIKSPLLKNAIKDALKK